MNGKLPIHWAALLSLPALVLSYSADAALIRGGGGTVQQDSFNETVELYTDQNFDYRASRLVSGVQADSYSHNSLQLEVHATPRADCWDNIQNPESGVFIRTDCRYEFQLGDTLELMGEVSYPLDGALYELTWMIWDADQSWTFTSTDLDFAFLSMAMPADMGPGVYNTMLGFRQMTPQGWHFFSYSNILDPYRCDEASNADNTGPEIVCGQIGSLRDFLSDTSRATTITILNRVPTPETLALMGLGVMGLLASRRKVSRR